ncbi:SufB/SufD family protein [Olsenella profusa]|uniref:SufD family Fe-S cluster assembly protein n=1 Tax=Olsenella profusa TaxID=138595 RepID=A0ABS2F327_9ACTN|nr:SufD family Fe-S cluster assembly protein [Olsenella profusa]MBM6775202.1 SufD family Fe-S cluster assembly protein [Olsenella profusa]
MMPGEKNLTPAGVAGAAAPEGAEAAQGVDTLTLERVNVAPAQTWNRLRTNDVTLTVPARDRKGDVYFALPRLFEGVECGMGPAVSSWAESQAAGARYVEVPRGEKREEPIVVTVSAAAGEVADTGVMVRAGAEATIVVAAGETLGTGSFVSSATDPAPTSPANPDETNEPVPNVSPTSGSLLRVIAERGAHVRIFEFIGVGAGEQHLESVGIHADADARVEVRQYALGGGTVALGLACDLAGDRARIDLAQRYHVGGTELLDVNEVVRHHGRNTRSELAYSGVLEDAARKSLRTTIDLVHGARGAQGNEAETVLVLGDDVTNKTLPVILCDEDDVAGNHGATIGSVSPEQLAFLASRGLSREDAEALFVRALYEQAAMEAPCDEARAVVEESKGACPQLTQEA